MHISKPRNFLMANKLTTGFGGMEMSAQRTVKEIILRKHFPA